MSSAEPPPSRPPGRDLQVVDDIEGEFAERVVDAFHYRPDELFRLVLSGGDVARRCYERLARHAEMQIDWWLVDVWAHDAELARRTLLDHVGAAYALHDLLVETVADAGTGTDPARRRHADVLHLDLAADGGLVGHLPVGWKPALVIVTACGARCTQALADIRAGAEVPANRLDGRNVVILADRAAAAAVPA
jgi:hypothetical protein